ncbi:glycine dehydrogenase [Moniliophthora roreri]|nr:glycine dehydrogenase [Moniliophthora roreri]
MPSRLWVMLFSSNFPPRDRRLYKEVQVLLTSTHESRTEGAFSDQIGAVESVKAASDIYAPVSGTIEEINETLSSEPGLLNKSPEEKGWLCRIKLSDPTEMDKLMTEEEYKASYEA